MACKYFLPFCRLSFYFVDLCCRGAFEFDVVPLVYFHFCCNCSVCFYVLSILFLYCNRFRDFDTIVDVKNLHLERETNKHRASEKWNKIISVALTICAKEEFRKRANRKSFDNSCQGTIHGGRTWTRLSAILRERLGGLLKEEDWNKQRPLIAPCAGFWGLFLGY